MKSSTHITVKLTGFTDSFAENKDIAKEIRVKYIIPALKANKSVVLDFSGVDSMTQSFTHALISDAVRSFPDEFFDRVSFKECKPTVERVIQIVSEYMQRSISNSH